MEKNKKDKEFFLKEVKQNGLLLRYAENSYTLEYENDLFDKSFELGKKTKEKVLIFDMDETLVSAKFESRIADHSKFITTFQFLFHGQTINVRLRPYLYK